MTDTPTTSTEKKSNPMMLIIVIVVLLLLVAGGYFFMKNKSTTSEQAKNEETKPAKTETNNPFTSIKDALSKSLTLECTFSDDSGRNYRTYIKNGAVRSDFTGKTDAETGSTIMKDKKMYFWNSKTAMMMTFDFEALQTSITPKPSTNQTSNGQQGADMMAMMEKYKNSCKPSVVADSLFTPPSNIKFTDFSELMKPPTTTTGSPTGMSQEDIQNLIKKYAPPEQ